MAASALDYSRPTRAIRIPASPFPSSTPEPLARDLFGFRALDGYTPKERAIVRAADRAFYALIAATGPTLRWELRGEERLARVYAANRRVVFAFWHNEIFFHTWFWRDRRIVVMTSRSLDGEYIARFIQRFGYGAARGSSTRGGARALVAQVRAIEAGYDAAFTVDGPKGPVYEAKAGPAMLAGKTGASIVPVRADSSSYWELSSWDRFRIPKPFSRAVVSIAEPIEVAPRAGDDAIESARRELQTRLDGLRREGESLFCSQHHTRKEE